jgi:hypothetical protein
MRKGFLFKKKRWSMPMFSGRMHTDVSADGKLLGLRGNYCFGMSHLNSSDDVTVTTIYEEGKEIKKISF